MEPIIQVRDAHHLNTLLHDQNKKIVLVGGCFDILHVGHISLLENARKQGDALVIFLESDQSITEKKGEGRPLHTQQQRADVLQALKAVDYVILLEPHMHNEDYDNLVKALQPDIIATTKSDPGWEYKKRTADLVGAQLLAVTQPIENISTSRIVSQLHKEI